MVSSSRLSFALLLWFGHLSKIGLARLAPALNDGIGDCGCPTTCTSTVLNRLAGEYRCIDRIQYLHKYENMNETEACRLISGVEYPGICGPACHPDWCTEHWPTQAPTSLPSSSPTEKLDCGCAETCTEDVLNRMAGKYTCGERMNYLWKFEDYTETEACQKIAQDDWPHICGPCTACFPTVSPTLPPSSAPTPVPEPPCGCSTCDEDRLANMAGAFSCRERIDYLKSLGWEDSDACYQIVALDYRTECNGPQGIECDPSRCVEQEPICGCNECNAQVLNTHAGPFTCGNRILHLQSPNGDNLTELEACRKVSQEFPSICGPACDPERCDGRTLAPSTAPSGTPTQSPSRVPSETPTNMPSSNPTTSPAPTHSPTTSVAPSLSPTQTPSTNPTEEARLCGCPNCTLSFSELTMAGDFSCTSRVDWLVAPWGGQLNSTWACIQIANSEYPQACGRECNPLTCHDTPTKPKPTFCGCQDCTPDVLNRDAKGVTCANRMAWLQTPIGGTHSELEACSKIAGSDFPDICGPECDPARCDGRGSPMCGCSTCDRHMLNLDAEGSTCGERIRYLQDPNGWNMTETEACLKIAADDFPQVCGPFCDPSQCHDIPTSSLRGGAK